MSNNLENEVRYFLRTSEDVKVTLDTLIVRRRGEEDRSWGDNKNRRVLAIVTHQNEFGEEEEGRYVSPDLTKSANYFELACHTTIPHHYFLNHSVFIFKYDPTVTLGVRLRVHRAYPILQNFSISMAQAKRPQASSELQHNRNPALVRSASGVSSLLIISGHYRTIIYIDLPFLPIGLTLTIWPGQDDVKPLTLLTQDVQSLQLVLAECKRLKEVGTFLTFRKN
jgi:hypothetical protein